MKVWMIKSKHYSLSWMSAIGYDNEAETFVVYRTRQAARDRLKSFTKSSSYYEIVAFVSDEKESHDVRRRSEWEKD